jgi:hypothetical protein
MSRGRCRTSPCDLRHFALSLWLASGAPPAEIAVRAGHSVQVLLSVYAHSVPGHEQATNPQDRNQPVPAGPPLAHKNTGRGPAARPPCVREQLSAPGLTWTPAGPRTRACRARQAGDLRKRPARRERFAARHVMIGRVPAKPPASR